MVSTIRCRGNLRLQISLIGTDSHEGVTDEINARPPAKRAAGSGAGTRELKQSRPCSCRRVHSLASEMRRCRFQNPRGVVGDGYAMGVAGQVVENVFGSPELWLGVDDPILPK